MSKEEEERRKEAEKKAKAEEKGRREAEEKARKEQEKRAKEEEKQKEAEEKARRKAEEQQRKEAERRAKDEADLAKRQEKEKRKAEEAERKEAERRAREEEKAKFQAAESARRQDDEKRKAEEEARREAEKRARKLEEQKRKDEAERLKREGQSKRETQKDAGRKPSEEASTSMKEPQPPTESSGTVTEEGVTLTVAQQGRQVPPGQPLSGARPGPLSPEEETAKEEAYLAERFKFLKNVKIRFPFTGTAVPPTWKVVERYPVNSPFAYAIIAQSPLSTRRYYLDEVPLTRTEAAIYSYLLDALEAELTVPREQVNPRQYFADQARKILMKYSIRVPAASWSKIIYFAERDLVGFGILDGMMRDPNIEDVSIDAEGKPVFIYHKGYESLETNVIFPGEEVQDNLITRLSHMAGKHVSTAFPIVQGTLPGRHRLVATFRREVSPHGSSATIRKFREDPLTIVDMLNLGLLDHKIAAYAWYLMQQRATSLVVGATGAGKTTLLNAILTLTRLTTKLVTIEEVQEINVPHLNWTSLVSRESYAATEERAGEVGLFDLVKAAMRMRPDILVVGEVRGEEAYVLFQAVATGHGGVATLHADDSSSALQRLVSAPMNVPKAFIPFMDLIFVVRRITIPIKGGGFRAVRRIISVDEVETDQEVYRAFRWDPKTDTFKASYDKSPKLERISRDTSVPMRDVLAEIERRSVVLHWVQQKGIRNFKELSPILELYVSQPEQVFQTASAELESRGISVSELVGDGSPEGQSP